MRIRTPFAASFAGLCLISAWLATTHYRPPFINGKVLHFTTFFALTVCFYWIFETSRRRVVNFTFFSITIGLSIITELGQSILHTERPFDAYNIAANVLGSGLALLLMQWYHKRMLERKRSGSQSRYQPLSTADDATEFEAPDLEAGGGGQSAAERGQELSSFDPSPSSSTVAAASSSKKPHRHDEEGEDGDIGGSSR
ncbi:hypothetical protein DFH27DRAFT_570804 [Peziza echinospora]|nr:hypothetical protein DFH27DRAFT_570804 [Peziza echinospora]